MVVWGGQRPQMLLLSWQLAASIDLSPLTKIPQFALLAHRFCFSIGGESWCQHVKGPHGDIVSAECKHSAAAECPAALHVCVVVGGGVGQWARGSLSKAHTCGRQYVSALV